MTLWEEMRQQFPAFPEGVGEIVEPITGSAFFPGGLGLRVVSGAESDILCGQIMVVGQDFDTEAKYREALKSPSGEECHPTWSRMMRLFEQYDIDPNECFFTNLYMGLRKHGPATGPFVGRKDPVFVERCAKFFEHQVAVVKPRLIIMFGLPAIQGAGKVLGIQHGKSLCDYNRVYRSELPHGETVVVLVTHPSHHKLNVEHRCYQDCNGQEFRGQAAETALMWEAKQTAFPGGFCGTK